MKIFKIYWYEPGVWVLEWGKRKYYVNQINLLVDVVSTVNKKTNPRGMIIGTALNLSFSKSKNSKVAIIYDEL